MGSRPPSATRKLYCNLPNRAARMKYHRWSEPEVLSRGPRGDGSASSLLLEATESSMSLAPFPTGQPAAWLPLKEAPGPGHYDQSEAPVLGGEDGRRDDELMPQCNDPSSCMTDYCFEPLAIPDAGSFECRFSFGDQATGEDWNGVDAGPSNRATDFPVEAMDKGARVILSCPENSSCVYGGAEGEKTLKDSSAECYLRSPAIQPAAALTQQLKKNPEIAN
ncbi:hypothetical protein HPB52_012280 [Rhipicephalus sanguineus]|uniref:Uncharacterized protein n=1 Tax=Rhipicephalus sanguineus TaxID=34632 RepID=A0A9D4T3W8_RHISA|nr:hypothetical protein HPB52_012280 [Rhipicephalus sanguineus]